MPLLNKTELSCTLSVMCSTPDALPDVKSIPISEFRQKCLALLPAIAERGGEIIVTRRGKPLAVVSPIRQSGPDTLYGRYSDGDIVYPDPTAPHYSDEEWDEIVDTWDANTG